MAFVAMADWPVPAPLMEQAVCHLSHLGRLYPVPLSSLVTFKVIVQGSMVPFALEQHTVLLEAPSPPPPCPSW